MSLYIVGKVTEYLDKNWNPFFRNQCLGCVLNPFPNLSVEPPYKNFGSLFFVFYFRFIENPFSDTKNN